MSSVSDSTFHERKEEEEEEKQEDHVEDEHLPGGQMLQKAEGAQSTENKIKKMEDDETVEEGPDLRKKEPQNEGKDWKLPIPLDPVSLPALSSNLSTAKGLGRNWELSIPITKNFRIQDSHLSHQPLKSPFQHLMDLKVERRLANRKERRSRFGDIDVHKCYPCGQIFSPFQALATMEMRKLVLPQDLLMSSHMPKPDASCFADMNLHELFLTSTELGLGKADDYHGKEKPVSHMKTPLFPPIVNVSKYNHMK
ncbi:uncharacterized protein [Dipodomys merriami]|uniref:uncharacterized protein n=1 Tax=Dipodomys merriami TaxID=94247 RepID=UPI003855952C